MNTLLGFSAVVVCLVLQATLAGASLRLYERNDKVITGGSLLAAMMVLVGVMALLLLGNLVQVAVWALLFYQLGEFATFADAYYHSAVNFATLGYGDIVMSESHRILGALEAITGILMVGISTAVLMAAMLESRSKRSTLSDN